MEQPKVSVLDNGLTVITVPTNTAQPYIELNVGTGGRHETDQNSGIAHYLEHIVAGATEHMTPKEQATKTNNMRGYSNASTYFERTNYYYRVGHEHLQDAMKMIATGVQEPWFDEANVEKERGAIVSELEMRGSNPDYISYFQFMDAAYDGNGLGRFMAGSRENIERFSAQELAEYMERFYTSDNMVLTVAGRVDHDEICQMAAATFDKLPRRQQGDDYTPPHQAYRGGYKTKESAEKDDLSFSLGFEGPADADQRDKAVAGLLASIIGGGFSSRLMEELRTKRGLVYGASAGIQTFHDAGLFNIDAGFNSENAEEAVNALCDELLKVTHTITEEELESVKNRVFGAIERTEDTEKLAKKALNNHLAYGKFVSEEELRDLYMSVTVEEVQAYAQKLFASPPTVSAYGKGVDKVPSYEEITERLGQKRELDARGFCKDTAPSADRPLGDAEVTAEPSRQKGREVA